MFIFFFILEHLGTIPSPWAFVGPPFAGTCLPTGVESPAMLGYWRGNWNGFWNHYTMMEIWKPNDLVESMLSEKTLKTPSFFLLFENPIEEVVYLSFISHIGICLSVKQGSFFVVPFRYAWFSNLSWGIRGLMSLSPYFRGTIGSLDPSNIYMYNIYIYVTYMLYIFLQLQIPVFHWAGKPVGFWRPRTAAAAVALTRTTSGRSLWRDRSFKNSQCEEWNYPLIS